MVMAQLGVFITNKVCWNAKNLVLKKIEAKFIEDFKVLNNYSLELKMTNPGSTVIVVVERNNPTELPVFQKIYICLSDAKEGFLASCRKLVGLDGCFLKGLLKGQLLVAVGRHGNNQMFPVAWTIVQKETSEAWSWFLEHLRSTSLSEMQKQLDQTRKLKGGDKAVDELLEKWPIQGWCKAFFSEVIKCEAIDNNMCEVFNGVILDERGKPVIFMLEDLRQYVISRIAVKREYANKWKGNYGPNIVAKLEKEKQKWNKTGIPYQHAMAAIAFKGEDPVNYLAHWFSKETYLKAYESLVSPTMRSTKIVTAATKKNQDKEVEQLTTASFVFPELSMQQSITSPATKDKSNP
ncbi:uncharacterized protein LOC120276135 [Dioscorea cayenensis subsp. rotundata]|uniref:Uncharacterized protein LOC120276135 n=1 Tax=Dioscorea cayennensis subsp. rotundata TaxID=55577 RepID=A0AB40CFU6_DIOCR|nr:uncharacterized protein LOC120276135 [Dioscorea cayenensis subsp. rotundata]